MNILAFSKIEKKVNVILDSDDLVTLCNIFYEMTKITDGDKRTTFYGMYDKFMMLSDLVQYGHIDAFRFEKMMECREKIQELASEVK